MNCASHHPVRNFPLDRFQIRSIWHDEEALAITSRFPDLPDSSFFAGILTAREVAPLVFDCQYPAVIEKTDEIRIEPIRRGLKPKRSRPAR